jgi:hypothetical protein
MSRSLSSFREPRNPLHRLSYPNPSRLNNRISWSSMTNHPLILHHMFLCVLVILSRTMLHLRLKPKIILHLRRRLMIYLLLWYNPLQQLHLLTILFISNDRALTQFYNPPLRVSYENQLSILMLMRPRTTTLLKIWPRHLQRCQLLKSFSLVLHKGRHC